MRICHAAWTMTHGEKVAEGALAVALMALYVYWAVLLHSFLCVIYSVEMGFRVFLGCVLCVLG